MIEGQILVDGRWREVAGGATLPVVNPSDGEAFALRPRLCGIDLRSEATTADPAPPHRPGGAAARGLISVTSSTPARISAAPARW